MFQINLFSKPVYRTQYSNLWTIVELFPTKKVYDFRWIMGRWITLIKTRRAQLDFLFDALSRRSLARSIRSEALFAVANPHTNSWPDRRKILFLKIHVSRLQDLLFAIPYYSSSVFRSKIIALWWMSCADCARIPITFHTRAEPQYIKLVKVLLL